MSDAGLPYEPFLVTAREVADLRAAYARGGVAVIGPPALDPRAHRMLIDEASEQRRVASWKLVGDPEPGKIHQDNTRGHVGPAGRELLAAGATGALLKAVTGHALAPGWSATCLTFYDEPGKHMGLHTDKPDACFAGLLLYLDARWPEGGPPSAGMQLHIYDDDRGSTLKLRVTARPNRAVIFFGSQLAHCRPPIAAGESLVMLNGCFRRV